MAAYDTQCGENVFLLQAAFQRDRAGEGFCFRARILRRVLRELQRDPRRVLAQLRHRLRKPPIDGAVHQQITEEKHEQRRCEAQNERAGEQPCPDARAEQPVLAVGIQLQHIAEEQNQQHQQQQKNQNGECSEKENAVAVPRVQEVQIERVEPTSRIAAKPGIRLTARRLRGGCETQHSSLKVPDLCGNPAIIGASARGPAPRQIGNAARFIKIGCISASGVAS